jgi:hypothetical protein
LQDKFDEFESQVVEARAVVARAKLLQMAISSRPLLGEQNVEVRFTSNPFTNLSASNLI